MSTSRDGQDVDLPHAVVDRAVDVLSYEVAIAAGFEGALITQSVGDARQNLTLPWGPTSVSEAC